MSLKIRVSAWFVGQSSILGSVPTLAVTRLSGLDAKTSIQAVGSSSLFTLSV